MDCFLCKELMQKHQEGIEIQGVNPDTNALYTETICKVCLAEAYPWEVCIGCLMCLDEKQEEEAIKVLRHTYVEDGPEETVVEVNIYWYYCIPCAQEYNINV